MKATISKYQTSIVAVALILAAALLFHQITVTIDRLEQEVVDRQMAACESQSEFRQAFPDILREIATGAEPVNILATEGFDALSPEVQFFLVRYAADVEASGNGGLLEGAAADYEKTFPLPDCKALAAELKRKFGKASSKTSSLHDC